MGATSEGLMGYRAETFVLPLWVGGPLSEWDSQRHGEQRASWQVMFPGPRWGLEGQPVLGEGTGGSCRGRQWPREALVPGHPTLPNTGCGACGQGVRPDSDGRIMVEHRGAWSPSILALSDHSGPRTPSLNS